MNFLNFVNDCMVLGNFEADSIGAVAPVGEDVGVFVWLVTVADQIVRLPTPSPHPNRHRSTGGTKMKKFAVCCGGSS